MGRGNFNNQTKRARELAKKDKRAAKDEKRARKKADARAAHALKTAPSTPEGGPAVKPAGTPGAQSSAAAGD